MKLAKPIKNQYLSLLAVVVGLAWPTVVEQIMQTSVQYIDTAMVGVLGTAATAAVGATTTVNWLIGSSLSAVGVGFLAFIAKAFGADNILLVKRAVSQAVLAVLVMGTLFTALTLSLSRFVPIMMQVEPSIQPLAARYFFILYIPTLPRTASIIFGTVLRASGDTKTPMIVGIGVNITNIVLNFFLIYPTRIVEVFGKGITVSGAGWGIEGAAAASAISFTLGGILIIVALFKHPVLSPKGSSIKPDMQVLKPCVRVAIPNMLQRFVTSLGYVVSASMINSVGEISTASHTIANTVESAFYIPGYGMQTAAATLVGNAVGAKDSLRLKQLFRVMMPLEIILMMISGGLLFVFAPDMVGLFSKDPQVISLGSTVLKMVALSEPFFGASIIMEGMLQGAGQTKTPFIFNSIGMWGIRILGMFVFINILDYGLVAAWGCMICHNVMLFIMFAIYFKVDKRKFIK